MITVTRIFAPNASTPNSEKEKPTHIRNGTPSISRIPVNILATRNFPISGSRQEGFQFLLPNTNCLLDMYAKITEMNQLKKLEADNPNPDFSRMANIIQFNNVASPPNIRYIIPSMCTRKISFAFFIILPPLYCTKEKGEQFPALCILQNYMYFITNYFTIISL